jgi:voltage-gated potassium channel
MSSATARAWFSACPRAAVLVDGERGVSSSLLNSDEMAASDLGPERQKLSLIDRRVQRIANARSVTLGLAATFLALAFTGAVVIRIADSDNFPSLGLAVWWALQTFTTVGYGDIVPTTKVGQIVGGLEMVTGISFIAFLVAGVTSTVIQRGEASAEVAKHEQREQEFREVVDALVQMREAINDIDDRLKKIESRLAS